MPRTNVTTLHASCAALPEDPLGILLLGPSGSGKSDLLLRLIDRGFRLAADDRINIEKGLLSPPPALAGLLEVRGLGILRLPFVAPVRPILAVHLHPGRVSERLPMPSRYEPLDLPAISVDPFAASAPILVSLAISALRGSQTIVTGAFG